MLSSIALFEAIVIALTCSLDAFAAAFSYGSNRIHIPWRSNQIINIISCAMLGISLWVGTKIQRFLPERLAITICFGILLILGLMKLMDCITKSIIRKHNLRRTNNLRRKYEFCMFNFRFILQLYANPEEADVDASKTLSSKEAMALAVSLSLDGIAVGFGVALGSASVLTILLVSLLSNTLAVQLGCLLGNRIARTLRFNISWVSGATLILLAFWKLL